MANKSKSGKSGRAKKTALQAVKSRIKGKQAGPKPMKRKRHPSPVQETRKIRIKKLAQDIALRRKLYAEQEQLWTDKLTRILGDRFIRQSIIDLAGENALEIIRNFKGKLSDEDLAKRLQLKISDVRATLNRLHNEGLVYYNRQKDSESGWYSYSWILHKTKFEAWASHQMDHRGLPELNGEDHYFCPTCGPETILPFEKATESEFRCEGCNRGLEFLDEEKIQALSKR